jgi:transposase
MHEVDHVAARIGRLEARDRRCREDGAGPHARGDRRLQALRGIALVSAVTIVAEVGELSRFAKPRQLMGYSGGWRASTRAASGRGAAASRRPAMRIFGASSIEAAWAYRHRPAVGAALRKRQATASAEVKEIAWKAQHRLHARYRKPCWAR